MLLTMPQRFPYTRSSTRPLAAHTPGMARGRRDAHVLTYPRYDIHGDPARTHNQEPRAQGSHRSAITSDRGRSHPQCRDQSKPHALRYRPPPILPTNLTKTAGLRYKHYEYRRPLHDIRALSPDGTATLRYSDSREAAVDCEPRRG